MRRLLLVLLLLVRLLLLPLLLRLRLRLLLLLPVLVLQLLLLKVLLLLLACLWCHCCYFVRYCICRSSHSVFAKLLCASTAVCSQQRSSNRLPMNTMLRCVIEFSTAVDSAVYNVRLKLVRCCTASCSLT